MWLSRFTEVLGGVRWPGGGQGGAAGSLGGVPLPASVAKARLRVLSRWVEVSAEMAQVVSREVNGAGESEPRADREGEVRQLLSRFLRQELGVAEVRFVPAALVKSESGPVRPWVVLHLAGCQEVVEVVLVEGSQWGEAERLLAERAAATAGSLLAMVAGLREARRQSLTDGLTGLLNRRSLDRMLEREVLLASRHQTLLSVVVIDLDHFKAANDRYGHTAGDALLRHVGRMLTQTLRRSDLAFRYGGDEFVVLLPQTGLNAAMATMEKLRRNVAATVPHGAAEGLPAPRLSIGVAEYWRGSTPQDLLRAADEALYRAKRESRDCVRAYRAAA
jgi:diguanylate cyclase (GGDEF)-like protein